MAFLRLCALHGDEKARALCGIYDYLSAHHPAIAWALMRWVKRVDPTWSREEWHDNPKKGVVIKSDCMLGGTVAKKVFCYGQGLLAYGWRGADHGV